MPALIPNKAITRDSLIAGLISTRYLTNGCNYLEIGLGEGYTASRILSEFPSTLLKFGPDVPVVQPEPNNVNVMTIDPYAPADHIYGDGTMVGTDIPDTARDILSGRYTGTEFYEIGTGTKFNIVFIDTSHRIQDTMSILKGIMSFIANDNDFVIINGVYPPNVEVQGENENRTGPVWCGNDWMLLYFLSELIKQEVEGVKFFSCDIDGGLVIMSKAALSKVIKAIDTQYGGMDSLIQHMRGDYKYERFLERLNDAEPLFCRVSEVELVAHYLRLTDYFFGNDSHAADGETNTVLP